MLSYSKTRPNLSAMKHAKPHPFLPNKHMTFPPGAHGSRLNFHWFQERSWMESCPSTFRVKCWVCRSQFGSLPNKDSLTSKKQDVFATLGWEGNKHVLQKLLDHENCKAHVMCMELHLLHVGDQQSTHVELNRHAKLQKEQNRKHFMTVVMNTQCLWKQNTSLRGHTKESSNLEQLMESSMRLRPKTHDFPNEHLSWKVQN